MKKFATAVAVTMLGATLAFAAPHEGGKGWGHGKRGGFSEKFAQELGLTDGQKAQIKAINQESREQMKQIRAANEAKIASLLTPEQNAKWQQLKADRAARHQDHQ